MDVLLDTIGRRRVRSMLLIYLFVVKAAADCLKPVGRGNLVLTNEALLMNDFPEGIRVTLECANGHVPESGSGITTCINGNWSEPDLICKKKDCGHPNPQPNMSFDIKDGTLFGASVTVRCNKGFQISGSSYKQCYAAGWSGRATCEIVTCETPLEVDNGRHSWDSQDEPKYGEIINYTCNEGFTLTGNARIMCSDTGEYDSQPPECIDVATEKIPSTKILPPTSMTPVQAGCLKPVARGNLILTNEALLMNDFPEGIRVTLECANGHVPESGSGITTCINGNWSEPDLICKKKDCGHPNPQPNMSFDIKDGTLFGASVKVLCNKGFQISGSSYKQCYAAGWSGRATCEIVTCETPPEVDNGRHSWDSQDEPKYGEIINYTCNEGFTLTGNARIMCSDTGEYDSQPPECIDVATEKIPSTKILPPTSMTPVQEVPRPSTLSSARAKTHRDKLTTSVTLTASPSARGGGANLTAEDKAAPTSVTSATSLEDEHDRAVDTNSNNGNTHVIVSVICVVAVVCAIVLFSYKFLLRRKGSYDTREDLKPELLQFQNL